ncbi:DUF5134 domain-containing protein [Streptomyces sp. NPDC085481]|uniref:DUF5134 domain-containing protein n=1 Tax=Streptomyces sp. NPDC085481 TaxID=3365727 RepID=UPI0037CD3BBF
MHGPGPSGWLLVALCAAGGAYCLLRMRRSAGRERRAAGSEAVMGFGMAAMALPAAALTPPGWVPPLYAGVFGLAAVYGLAGAVRRGGDHLHHLHHLVGSLAMVYMAVAMAAAPPPASTAEGHAGHAAAGTGGIPVVTGVLLAYYGVYVLRSGTRLVPVAVQAVPAGPARSAGVPAGGAFAVLPELTLVCRLSMALAMLAMLLTL